MTIWDSLVFKGIIYEVFLPFWNKFTQLELRSWFQELWRLHFEILLLKGRKGFFFLEKGVLVALFKRWFCILFLNDLDAINVWSTVANPWLSVMRWRTWLTGTGTFYSYSVQRKNMNSYWIGAPCVISYDECAQMHAISDGSKTQHLWR